MRFPLFLCCLFLLVISTVANIAAQTGPGTLFTVNSTADTVDTTPGDALCADANGQCTLRAAIQEANSNPSNLDVIIFDLPNPSVIDLTAGELAITGPTQIVGQGTRRLTVERSPAAGTPNFRIFHVTSSAIRVDIRRMKIFNGNAGDQNGGGLLVEQGSTVGLIEIALTSNAAASGGGIANSGGVLLTRSLINANVATTQGGGILNIGGSAVSPTSITDSTVTDNSASAGGAIHNTGTLLLVNDTIARNAASDAARSIFNDAAGTITSLNTIIGNDDPAAAVSLSGAFVSAGNNLVTDARGSSGFANGVNGDQVSDNNSIDPLLGSLSNNGGQTDTRALLTGSPAINAGNSCVRMGNCGGAPRIGLNSDQRTGFSRLFGASVDVGAFEAGSTSGGGIGFGLGFASFGRSNRYAGSVAVLINSSNGQRQYAPINPFGNFRFQSFALDVYILDIKAKRMGVRSGPSVFAFDDIAFFNLPIAANGFTIQITDTKSEGRPK